MAHLSRTLIGKKASATAAALALGAAILALTPGQIAYAARGIANEAGDTDSGGAPGKPTTTVKRQKSGDNGVRCTITGPDGTIDFYLPGETIVRGKDILVCGESGEWVVLGPPRPATDHLAPGGGVYTQVP